MLLFSKSMHSNISLEMVWKTGSLCCRIPDPALGLGPGLGVVRRLENGGHRDLP